MFQRTKLHGGLMADCAVCTPDRKKKRRDREDRPTRERATTLDGYLRRQMSEEIGEDELSKDFRFQVMQKYGSIAPRIDRRVTKPSWMSTAEWSRKRQEFHTQTVGLIPSQQYGRNNERNTSRTSRSTFRKITGSASHSGKIIRNQRNMAM